MFLLRVVFCSEHVFEAVGVDEAISGYAEELQNLL
jgi:hypothetical protein